MMEKVYEAECADVLIDRNRKTHPSTDVTEMPRMSLACSGSASSIHIPKRKYQHRMTPRFG